MDTTPNRSLGVQLQCSLQCGTAPSEGGSPWLRDPLIELLTAVRNRGSIQHAAKALGRSYRHVWGQLKEGETRLNRPLVHWIQGQPARLTPDAEALCLAHAQALQRLEPLLREIHRELSEVWACAGESSR